MKTSSLFALNVKDIAKSLLVAAGGAVITTIQTSLQAGTFNLNWKLIATVATSAGLSYLSKNFFTPAQFLTPVK